MVKFLFLLFFFINPYLAFGNDMNKFDWRASESAPQHYLMEIVNGVFISKNNRCQRPIVSNIRDY